MDFLKSNLNNSLILPFDVMLIIYQYADPFYYIHQQIDNGEYCLNDIM